jgi:peptide/nickel transport system ATP-binding protein
MSRPIVRVRDLKKHFPVGGGFLRKRHGTVRAVDGVSFDIAQGETFGLVGESGCGKTTVGRTLIRAHRPTSGEMLFSPTEEESHDLVQLRDKDLLPLRTEMQMIFQDPYSSLSPRMTVKQIVGEPLIIHKRAAGSELEARVEQTLATVGLDPGHLNRYPHAFSGGQRQRIGLARALIINPKFIVADEPVSALDVSVQAQILELFVKLKEEYGLSYLFVSHDLSVVRYISDRVAVMYVGKLVELAPSKVLFDTPRHPYTRALISVVPIPDPHRRDEPELLEGEVADAANPPPGCLFHPRCKFARERCRVEEPTLRNIAGEDAPHIIACHFAEEIS